jgi:hypothetical protein
MSDLKNTQRASYENNNMKIQNHEEERSNSSGDE